MEKILISLTSYPARINTVHKVIESLFEQTLKADKIVLWLSKQEFPRQYEELPSSLRRLVGTNGFCIEWVSDNLKSHKKYYYTLADSKNYVVITIDDDIQYSPTMVSTLMNSYIRHPYAISARRVRMIFRKDKDIAPYTTWESYLTEYADKERMDLCAIGVGGVLYPPRCASARWFDKKCIKECAENQDDLWLKFNEIIDNIPVVYAGIREKDTLVEGTQGCALYTSNVTINDLCIKKLVNTIRIDYEKIYNDWFGSLMSIEYFVISKRNYYRQRVEELCALYKNDNLYICGAGKYAHILFEFIKNCGEEKRIKAFVVSDYVQKKDLKDGIAIKQIKELNEKKEFAVICGVNEENGKEIKRHLEKVKLCNWIDVDIQGIVRLKQLESVYLRELKWISYKKQ